MPVNDLAQAVLPFLGPFGIAAVWWFKRRDDARLRGRVDACEKDRAELHAKLDSVGRRLIEQEGCVKTLTAILGREINVG